MREIVMQPRSAASQRSASRNSCPRLAASVACLLIVSGCAQDQQVRAPAPSVAVVPAIPAALPPHLAVTHAAPACLPVEPAEASGYSVEELEAALLCERMAGWEGRSRYADLLAAHKDRMASLERMTAAAKGPPRPK